MSTRALAVVESSLARSAQQDALAALVEESCAPDPERRRAAVAAIGSLEPERKSS